METRIRCRSPRVRSRLIRAADDLELLICDAWRTVCCKSKVRCLLNLQRTRRPTDVEYDVTASNGKSVNVIYQAWRPGGVSAVVQPIAAREHARLNVMKDLDVSGGAKLFVHLELAAFRAVDDARRVGAGIEERCRCVYWNYKVQRVHAGT